MNDSKSRRESEKHQAIIDPITGKDITGDVVSKSEEEMKKEIEHILDSATTENIIESIEHIEDVLEKHYRSLKLPIDERKLEKIFARHAKKVYPELFSDLDMIGKISQNHGLEYRILTKPKLSFHFGWNTKSRGLWVIFYKQGCLHSTLYAMPIVEMETNTYGPYFIGGEPPAAEIVKATKRMILFASQESTPPQDYLKKIRDVKMDWNELALLAPKRLGTILEVEYTDPVVESAPAEHSEQEVIEEAKKDKQLKAVSFVISGYPHKRIVPL